MIIHFHSNVSIAELGTLLPYHKIQTAATKEGGAAKPPFLVAVDTGSDDYAMAMATLKGIETLHPGKIVTLPHPRDASPLPSNVVQQIKKHLPNVKDGHTTLDVLKHLHTDSPCELWNPSNFF